MTKTPSPYGPLPPEGGSVGFVGIAADGREGARENTGNFLHGYAARRLVGQYVNVPNRPLTDEKREEYRARLTHLAFVGATTIAVDNSLVGPHEETATLIERMGLPVVVFGLGSRAPLGQSLKTVAVHPSTVRLLKVLSDHAPTIAVRGEFTAELCRHLGIHNVEAVGCQSCFLSGRADFRFPALDGVPDLARSIVNFTRPSQEWPLFRAAMAAQATVIGQSSHFEYDLQRHPDVTGSADLSPALEALMTAGMRRLIAEGKLSLPEYQAWIKARFHQFYTMPDWFGFLAQGFDFCIGTRFHGNMSALQAGIPALWVVHDMRTREFCDLLGLPNVPLAKVQAGTPLPRLVETHFDTSAFDRKYPENYARFVAYLDRHGLPHRMAPMAA